MGAVEIADRLHEDASAIIHNCGLDAALRPAGQVYYGGSYVLNAMAWPDLDVNVLMEPDPESLTAFFEIGRAVAQIPNVASMRFSNCLTHRVKGWPRGLYWGIRMDHGNWPIQWKLDVWAIDRSAFEESIALMDGARSAMTEKARRLIVEVKHALLQPDGRTPALSGYHIYRAVLFEGITELEGIKHYLCAQGIQGIHLL